MFGDWLRDTAQYLRMRDEALDASARMLSGFERAQAVIPGEIYARRREVYPAHAHSQRHPTIDGPITFLHGDVHPGKAKSPGVVGFRSCG